MNAPNVDHSPVSRKLSLLGRRDWIDVPQEWMRLSDEQGKRLLSPTEVLVLATLWTLRRKQDVKVLKQGVRSLASVLGWDDRAGRRRIRRALTKLQRVDLLEVTETPDGLELQLPSRDVVQDPNRIHRVLTVDLRHGTNWAILASFLRHCRRRTRDRRAIVFENGIGYLAGWRAMAYRTGLSVQELRTLTKTNLGIIYQANYQRPGELPQPCWFIFKKTAFSPETSVPNQRAPRAKSTRLKAKPCQINAPSVPNQRATKKLYEEAGSKRPADKVSKSRASRSPFAALGRAGSLPDGREWRATDDVGDETGERLVLVRYAPDEEWEYHLQDVTGRIREPSDVECNE